MKKKRKNILGYILGIIAIAIIIVAVIESDVFKEDKEPVNIYNGGIDIVPDDNIIGKEDDVNNVEDTTTRLDEVANSTNNETINNDTDNNVDNQEVNGPVTTEEKAIELVKQNWGDDDTVYFVADGKDENGNYIVCVREKSSTKALYWYTVDRQDGTLNIQ